MRGKLAIFPGMEHEFAQECIHSWNFQRLLAWAHTCDFTLSIQTELMLCYAQEKMGDGAAWSSSISKLRQRVFSNECEHFCFRALSIQAPKKLLDITQDLLKKLTEPFDFIVEISAIRVADYLVLSRQNLDSAGDIYRALSRTQATTEWRRIVEIKNIIVRYLQGSLQADGVKSFLQEQNANHSKTSITSAFHLCFMLYLSHVTGDLTHQKRLQKQVRSTLKINALNDNFNALSKISDFLLYPEQSLQSSLWSCLLPEQLNLLEILKSRCPEIVWLDYYIQALDEIKSFALNSSLPALKLSLIRYENSNNNYLAACTQMRILSILLTMDTDEQLAPYRQTWHNEISKLESSSNHELQSHAALFKAARSYRLGEFDGCLSHLKLARRLTLNLGLRQIISSWLESARGKISRNLEPALEKKSLHLLDNLFGPILENIGAGTYRISGHYIVDLNGHPILRRLLQQVLDGSNKQLITKELFDQVWHQSSPHEDWKQKIRNTVSRLRFQFRFLLSPIVLQTQGCLYLNVRTVKIKARSALRSHKCTEEILRALQQKPLNIKSLAEITCIPKSSLRRYLCQLEKKGTVKLQRNAQSITYRLQAGSPQKDTISSAASATDSIENRP